MDLGARRAASQRTPPSLRPHPDPMARTPKLNSVTCAWLYGGASPPRGRRDGVPPILTAQSMVCRPRPGFFGSCLYKDIDAAARRPCASPPGLPREMEAHDGAPRSCRPLALRALRRVAVAACVAGGWTPHEAGAGEADAGVARARGSGSRTDSPPR